MSRRNRGSAPVSLPSLDRRQFLRIFGAVAAVGATGSLTACGSDAITDVAGQEPSGLTVNIGLLVPKSGQYAKIGDDIQKGFALFLAGRRGLLGPHNANLIVADEGTTAETSLAAVEGLLSQNAVAIAGVANPAALPALADAVQKARVPLVSANAAPSTLTNALFVWRVSSVEGDSGRSLSQYAKVQGSRAYLLYEETSSGGTEAEAFRRAFVDLGGLVVGESVGTGSLANRFQTARNLDADSIFASYSGDAAAAVIDAYRASGVTAKLLGTGSLTETIDLTKIGPLPQRVYTSMYYAADLDNEANRRFVSEFHKAHGTQPSGYAMAAYDSAAVLDKALGLTTGQPTGPTLNQAFSLLGQIDSPRGIWTFNINRSPQQKWYLRRLHLDGQVPANILDTDLTVLG